MDVYLKVSLHFIYFIFFDFIIFERAKLLVWMFLSALFHCIRTVKSDGGNYLCYPYCVQGFTLRWMYLLKRMCGNELGGNEWAGCSCDWRVKHAKRNIFFSISMTDRPKI